jgi:coenzyme PQQ precursor peptide PqqA
VCELSLNSGNRSVLLLKGTIMNWETPSFEEIDMSAEIGSYQGEDDNGL